MSYPAPENAKTIRAMLGDRIVSSDCFDWDSAMQLYDYHQNMYHDSYFYGLFVDKNGGYIWTEYASTAYSGSMKFVQATAEMKQAFRKELDEYHIKSLEEWKSQKFKELLAAARKAKKKFGVTNTLRAKQAVRMIGCERTKKLIGARSSFKKSLLNQTLKWIEEGSEYKYPLTINQMRYI